MRLTSNPGEPLQPGRPGYPVSPWKRKADEPSGLSLWCTHPLPGKPRRDAGLNLTGRRGVHWGLALGEDCPPPPGRRAHLHAVHTIDASLALFALQGAKTEVHKGRTAPPGQKTRPQGRRRRVPAPTHLVTLGSPGSLQSRGERVRVGGPPAGGRFPGNWPGASSQGGRGGRAGQTPHQLMEVWTRGRWAGGSPVAGAGLCAPRDATCRPYSPSPPGSLFLPTEQTEERGGGHWCPGAQGPGTSPEVSGPRKGRPL